MLLLVYCLGVWMATLLLAPGLVILVSGAGLLFLILLRAVVPEQFGKTRCAINYALCFLLGIIWHMLWAQSILQQRLPAELEGIDMWVEGAVTGLPVLNSRTQQFQFHIQENDAAFSDRRVLLNYYGDQVIRPGQHWRLLVRLNRPHGFANPGTFDYEARLFQQKITAKGYIRNDPGNRLLSSRTGSLQGLRFRIRETLLERSEQYPAAPLILALTIGDYSALAKSDWQVMSDTGTNHLFVISGMHIAMIAAACFWLGKKLLRFIPGLRCAFRCRRVRPS